MLLEIVKLIGNSWMAAISAIRRSKEAGQENACALGYTFPKDKCSRLPLHKIVSLESLEENLLTGDTV